LLIFTSTFTSGFLLSLHSFRFYEQEFLEVFEIEKEEKVTWSSSEDDNGTPPLGVLTAHPGVGCGAESSLLCAFCGG
jgi:hypothetical protein